MFIFAHIFRQTNRNGKIDSIYLQKKKNEMGRMQKMWDNIIFT